MNKLQNSLFVALFVSTAVWFALIAWKFRRLRDDHPATFEELGSPSLFTNNTPLANWLVLKFLLRAGWIQLDDPLLAKICGAMRVHLAAHFTLLLAFATTFLH